MMLCLDHEAHGEHNKLTVGYMVSRAKHPGVKHRATKPTSHEDKVQHVARSRAVSIAIPSHLMEWLVEPCVGRLMECLVLEPCVSIEELFAHIEVHQPHAILIALPKAMGANHDL